MNLLWVCPGCGMQNGTWSNCCSCGRLREPAKRLFWTEYQDCFGDKEVLFIAAACADDAEKVAKHVVDKRFTIIGTWMVTHPEDVDGQEYDVILVPRT